MVGATKHHTRELGSELHLERVAVEGELLQMTDQLLEAMA